MDVRLESNFTKELDHQLLRGLQDMLMVHNPYVQAFREAASCGGPNVNVCLHASPKLDMRRYNITRFLKWLHSYLKMMNLRQHQEMSLFAVEIEEFKESTSFMPHMIPYILFCHFQGENKDGPIIFLLVLMLLANNVLHKWKMFALTNGLKHVR